MWHEVKFLSGKHTHIRERVGSKRSWRQTAVSSAAWCQVGWYEIQSSSRVEAAVMSTPLGETSSGLSGVCGDAKGAAWMLSSCRFSDDWQGQQGLLIWHASGTRGAEIGSTAVTCRGLRDGWGTDHFKEGGDNSPVGESSLPPGAHSRRMNPPPQENPPKSSKRTPWPNNVALGGFIEIFSWKFFHRLSLYRKLLHRVYISSTHSIVESV